MVLGEKHGTNYLPYTIILSEVSKVIKIDLILEEYFNAA